MIGCGFHTQFGHHMFDVQSIFNYFISDLHVHCISQSMKVSVNRIFYNNIYFVFELFKINYRLIYSCI